MFQPSHHPHQRPLAGEIGLVADDPDVGTAGGGDVVGGALGEIVVSRRLRNGAGRAVAVVEANDHRVAAVGEPGEVITASIVGVAADGDRRRDPPRGPTGLDAIEVLLRTRIVIVNAVDVRALCNQRRSSDEKQSDDRKGGFPVHDDSSPAGSISDRICSNRLRGTTLFLALA